MKINKLVYLMALTFGANSYVHAEMLKVDNLKSISATEFKQNKDNEELSVTFNKVVESPNVIKKDNKIIITVKKDRSPFLENNFQLASDLIKEVSLNEIADNSQIIITLFDNNQKFDVESKGNVLKVILKKEFKPVIPAVASPKVTSLELPKVNTLANVVKEKSLDLGVINSINFLNVNKEDNADKLQIVFDSKILDKPLIENKQDKIIIEFNKFNSVEKEQLLNSINSNFIKSIQIQDLKNKTKVILNVKNKLNYIYNIDNDVFAIRFSEKNLSKEDIPTINKNITLVDRNEMQKRDVLSNKLATKSEVRSIDFQKLEGGSGGQLVIELSNSSFGIDVKKSNKDTVIELNNTKLPEFLRKKYNVSSFSTPVKTIEAGVIEGKTKILLRNSGDYEQAAYQLDNKLIIEIKPVYNQVLTKVKKYSGDKMTLNFQDVNIRAIIQAISDFSGINMIASDDVDGTVSLRLKDVPWDQALDIILESHDLGKKKIGDNVLWIAPSKKLAEKEQAELQSKKNIQELQPLVTESFQLNYEKAEAVKSMIDNASKEVAKTAATNTPIILNSAPGQTTNTSNTDSTSTMKGLLSSRGTIVANVRTNTIFVSDIPEKMEEIRGLIKKIDSPVKQVLIEARIIEASDTFGKNIGVKLGMGGSASLGSNGGISFGSSASSSGKGVGNGLNVSLPASSINGASASTFAFSLFNSSGTKFLNLELSALVAEGKGSVISNPKIVTADQREASISEGTEIPYSVVDSSGNTSTSFKKAELSLKAKPQITPDGNVIMDLMVTKDSRGTDTDAGPAINTKKLDTQVLVENGGTVVIGGIYVQEESQTINKVPLLGDLPYLGNLFKSKEDYRERRELLVLITPRVINNQNVDVVQPSNEEMNLSERKPLIVKDYNNFTPLK